MNNNILNRLGVTLNAMQEVTADAVLHTGKNIVMMSPTDSGKIYAYPLPLIQRLDILSDILQAIVLVPGRELALRPANVLKDIGSSLHSMPLYGGCPTMEGHRVLRGVEPQIVFATPERLNDHLDKANINAETIKWLVIDESDKYPEPDFRDEMMNILCKLPNIERQILLSATESETIPNFVLMGGAVHLGYRTEGGDIPNRTHLYTVTSPEEDRLEVLKKLLLPLGGKSNIVFSNHCGSIERTALFLEENDFTISWFHGDLDQRKREASLYRFSNSSASILVSTGLALRGLGMPDADSITHYHFPETEDGHVHRVGRTARWNKEGGIFFILDPEGRLPEHVTDEHEKYKIPKTLPKPTQPRTATIYIGKGKGDKIPKIDIVSFLCEKGGLKSSEIGKIDVKDRFTYVAVSCIEIKEIISLTKDEKIKGIRTVVKEVR